MHVIVSVLLADDLRGGAELVAVFVLRCQLNVGEDGKLDCRFCDYVEAPSSKSTPHVETKVLEFVAQKGGHKPAVS